MEHTIFSILPSFITIILALVTKEIYISLVVGIFSGVLIYSRFNLIDAIVAMFDIMKEQIGANLYILAFLVISGTLLALISSSGATYAYGELARQRIKSPRGSMLLTMLLGIVIFIDDYFSSLTVGAVMRPVTDKFKISRAKLAYIIDSTTAPICILAPVSSWAIAVTSSFPAESGIDGFDIFLKTIPCNIYAWLTLIFLAFIILSGKDFGAMRKAVLESKDELQVADEYKDTEPDLNSAGGRGHVIDLALPLIVFIFACVLSMFYTGGFMKGVSFADAFANCDASKSLVIGSFIALLCAALLYLPRKIVTFDEFGKSFGLGFKTVSPAIFILCLAWTLSGVCDAKHLDLGGFTHNIIAQNQIFEFSLPPVFFLLAFGISFATGVNWGTFGILMPLIATSIDASNGTLLTINAAAVLSGAIAGDHASPISNTTILSSAAAKCSHIDHVNTQLPYAVTVAVCAFIGYIVSGLTEDGFIGLGVGAVCLYFALTYVYLKEKKHSVVERMFKNSMSASIANKFARDFGVAGVLVGKFWGMEALAAYGLACPMVVIFSLPGSTVSGGARSLYNEFIAQGKLKEANSVFNLGIMISFVSSAILSIITYLFITNISSMLGAEGHNASILPFLSDYVLGLACGITTANLAKYAAGFLPIDGNSKLVVTGATVTMVVNVIADIVVITLLDGGLFMVGLANGFSRLCYLLVISAHFFRKERMLRLSFDGITTDMKSRVLTILRNCVPAFVSRMCISAGMLFTNKILSAAATSHYLAAYSARTGVYTYISPLYMGLSDTVWSLAGIFCGEKDRRALDELQKVTIYIGLSINLAVGLILFLFAPFISELFIDKDDAQTYALIIEAMRAFAIGVPLNHLFYSFTYYLMGVGRLNAANVFLSMISFTLIVPVVWVMVKIFGGSGSWISEPVTLFILLIGAGLYIAMQKGGEGVTKRLLLPSNLVAAPINEINVSVYSLEEVAKISERAKILCQKNNIDAKETNTVSRCIEKLGANILNRGFADGKKHALDLRVILDYEGITLRFRDDCPQFNIVDYCNANNNADELSLIIKSAKYASYSSILGTNNLIIKI